jgi:hypothetical protein
MLKHLIYYDTYRVNSLRLRSKKLANFFGKKGLGYGGFPQVIHRKLGDSLRLTGNYAEAGQGRVREEAAAKPTGVDLMFTIVNIRSLGA